MSLAVFMWSPASTPEAARVDAERLVEAVLGAEVGDRAVEGVAVPALEPVVRAVGHVRVELGEDVVVLGEELGVVEEARPVDRAADDRDRVAVAVPRRAVDQATTGRASAGARPSAGCRRAGAGLRAGAAAGTQAAGIDGTWTRSMGGDDTAVATADVNRFSARRGHGATALRRARVRCRACRLRVAFLAAECEPWAKTGGLADVVDALARALGAAAGRRVETPVDVFLPRYRAVPVPRRACCGETAIRVPGSAGAGRAPATSRSSTSPADGYRLRLVDHPAAFDRDGLLRRRGRRLRRQRLAVRAVLPGRARGAARGRPARRRPPPARLAHRAGGDLPRRALRGRPDHRRGRDPADAPQPRLPRLDAARPRSASSGCGRATGSCAADADGIDLLRAGHRAGRARQHGLARVRGRGADAGLRDGPRWRPAREGRPVHRDPQRPRHDASGTRRPTRTSRRPTRAGTWPARRPAGRTC